VRDVFLVQPGAHFCFVQRYNKTFNSTQTTTFVARYIPKTIGEQLLRLALLVLPLEGFLADTIESIQQQSLSSSSQPTSLSSSQSVLNSAPSSNSSSPLSFFQTPSTMSSQPPENTSSSSSQILHESDDTTQDEYEDDYDDWSDEEDEEYSEDEFQLPVSEAPSSFQPVLEHHLDDDSDLNIMSAALGSHYLWWRSSSGTLCSPKQIRQAIQKVIGDILKANIRFSDVRHITKAFHEAFSIPFQHSNPHMTQMGK
jgi:hypothetical protein